jgi:hypothetical protein
MLIYSLYFHSPIAFLLGAPALLSCSLANLVVILVASLAVGFVFRVLVAPRLSFIRFGWLLRVCFLPPVFFVLVF